MWQPRKLSWLPLHVCRLTPTSSVRYAIVSKTFKSSCVVESRSGTCKLCLAFPMASFCSSHSRPSKHHPPSLHVQRRHPSQVTPAWLDPPISWLSLITRTHVLMMAASGLPQSFKSLSDCDLLPLPPLCLATRPQRLVPLLVSVTNPFTLGAGCNC